MRLAASLPGEVGSQISPKESRENTHRPRNRVIFSEHVGHPSGKTGEAILETREEMAMKHTPDTLLVKVYDGEGDSAKLIFEGTAREWEIFRTTHNWGVLKESPSQKTEDD